MSKLVTTSFKCSACGAMAVSCQTYADGTPMDWRELRWSGAYQGDEHRVAHFCHKCHPKYLKALDTLLQIKKATTCTS